MNKFLLTVMTLLLLSSSASFGQERTVTGVVTSSEDGSPAPGVNVLVKGTTIGTATDIDGRYSITVPDGNATLVFSFIGFKSIEQSVGSSSTINITMEPDAVQLSELVVVGYGTQIKQ